MKKQLKIPDKESAVYNVDKAYDFSGKSIIARRVKHLKISVLAETPPLLDQ
ncbi:MAG: hypothetical protein ACOYEL_04795 [Saccharofermentanales bacterium]